MAELCGVRITSIDAPFGNPDKQMVNSFLGLVFVYVCPCIFADLSINLRQKGCGRCPFLRLAVQAPVRSSPHEMVTRHPHIVIQPVWQTPSGQVGVAGASTLY